MEHRQLRKTSPDYSTDYGIHTGVPLSSPQKPVEDPPVPPYVTNGPSVRPQKTSSRKEVGQTPNSYHTKPPNMIDSKGKPYEPFLEGGIVGQNGHSTPLEHTKNANGTLQDPTQDPMLSQQRPKTLVD